MSGQVEQKVTEQGGNGASIPEVSVKIKQSKGAKPGVFDVSNQAALDALAEFGGASDAIRVERVAPATHDGRRVQLGDLPLTVTVEDLRDPARLHSLLGPRGREFLIKAGNKAIRFKPVGHELTALDYEPDDVPKAVPHTVVVGANGVPMAVPIPQPTGFPQNPYASPWGMYPMAQGLQPDAIAKAVSDAIAASKKGEASEKLILELEEKRIVREEKKADREREERKEAREREERRAEKDEKERRDAAREAREREEKRVEREDKDKKERAEKEEKERRDREERERRDREERDKRWLEEQKAAREERTRSHDLEAKRIEENARVQLEIAKRQADAAESAAKIAAQSQKEFFEMRLKELEASKDNASDPLEMLERLKKIADGPRTSMGEFFREAPMLVKALGEEFSRVKATPPALPAPGAGNPPGDPLKTLTRDELFSAIRTFGDAIRGGHSVEQVLPLMRRAKIVKADGSMDAAASGVPNMVEKCRIDAPEKVLQEIQALPQHPSVTDAEKALIADVLGLAASDKGKAWLLEFFARVKS